MLALCLQYAGDGQFAAAEVWRAAAVGIRGGRRIPSPHQPAAAAESAHRLESACLTGMLACWQSQGARSSVQCWFVSSAYQVLQCCMCRSHPTVLVQHWRLPQPCAVGCAPQQAQRHPSRARKLAPNKHIVSWWHWHGVVGGMGGREVSVVLFDAAQTG